MDRCYSFKTKFILYSFDVSHSDLPDIYLFNHQLNNFMKSSLKSLNFAHEKNIRFSSPKIQSVGEIEVHSYPRNTPYLQPSIQPSLAQSTVKQFNRAKMIEQNLRLKQCVWELAEQLDQTLSKEKQKKRYGLHINEVVDEEARIKQLQAKKQQIIILKLKNEIFHIKKQNVYVYDNGAIIEKQNAVKALEIQLKQLENQRSAFLKVRRQQDKALFTMKDDLYFEKYTNNKSQLARIKQQCKILTNKTLQNQKMVLREHQKKVTKNKKIKQIEEKIRKNKEKLKKGSQNIVTMEMISQIESEIMKLESDYKEQQKNWLQKINNLDTEYNNRRVEQQQKLIILKDKEKEVKLNEIRLKEFKKLADQNRNQKRAESIDARNFRNNRNIQYLEKPIL